MKPPYDIFQHLKADIANLFNLLFGFPTNLLLPVNLDKIHQFIIFLVFQTCLFDCGWKLFVRRIWVLIILRGAQTYFENFGHDLMFWSILRQWFFFLYCYLRVCLMALVLSQKCEKVSTVDRMHNISDERFQNITLYRNQFWCWSEFSVPPVLSGAESIHSTCNTLRDSGRCLALCYFDIYCPCLHNLSQWSDILNVTTDNWDH